jgi:hypothetical protein
MIVRFKPGMLLRETTGSGCARRVGPGFDAWPTKSGRTVADLDARDGFDVYSRRHGRVLTFELDMDDVKTAELVRAQLADGEAKP